MANAILDILIAKNKAKLTLVDMTPGYGVPSYADPNGPGINNPVINKENVDKLVQALLWEVVPAVQGSYGASNKSSCRVITGLSLGGAKILYGGLPNGYDAGFQCLNFSEVNRKLKLLWIVCRTQDGFIKIIREVAK